MTTRSSSRGPPSRFRIVRPSRDVILNFERHANGPMPRGGGRTKRFSPNSYRHLCDIPLARSFSCIFHRLNVSWYVAFRGFSEYNGWQKYSYIYCSKLLRVYCTYYTYTHTHAHTLYIYIYIWSLCVLAALIACSTAAALFLVRSRFLHLAPKG